MYTRSTPINSASVQDSSRQNPLAITKAVDFTDDEINSMWVDWPNKGGFAEFFSVSSPMPRIIRGGKGIGRTHMMRHFSAPVQVIRGGEDPVSQVRQDGVLGIYVLCSGLNSDRFQGRGRGPETWQSVFHSYADIWLAQAALDAFLTVSVTEPPSAGVEREIVEDISRLMIAKSVEIEPNIVALREYLYRMQRDIDNAVNNAALDPSATFDFAIQSTPGELVFGIPTAIRRNYEPLSEITFLYLIDEFENFEVAQQKYVNTLIREKQLGTSFMIGVRTYGLRTLSTLGGGEENKRGSEFEEFRPELNYVGTEKRKFSQFCHKVVARRLAQHGLMDDVNAAGNEERLARFFETPNEDHVEDLVRRRYEPADRPYLKRLENNLRSYTNKPNGDRLSVDEIQFIIDAIRVPSRPLLEKINILLLYRGWYRNINLMDTARKIKGHDKAEDASGLIQPNPIQKKILNHFVTDLKAQLCNDMRVPQIYAGFREFVVMADGLPRNLLVILKNTYKWSLFHDESPFTRGVISLDSQRLGVREAAEWFFADAKPLGADGDAVQAAINRMGTMFRRFRFSDKPVESSLASFSTDLTSCTARAKEIVEIAEQRALLMRAAKSQKNRNTGLEEPKFHLNRLLSPIWDLPIARRGAIRLNSEEVNAIFDPRAEQEFSSIVARRLNRMRVPFGAPEPKTNRPKLL